MPYLLNILQKGDFELFNTHIKYVTKCIYEDLKHYSKKIILCNSDCGELDRHFFNRFCQDSVIEQLYIIIDAKKQKIFLAYNREYIESSANLAFNGDEIDKIKSMIKHYDGEITDFNIETVNTKDFIRIQTLSHEKHKIDIDYEVRNIFIKHSHYKTDYEIKCMYKANLIAIKAHIAVQKEFNDNKTCSEIHLYNIFNAEAKHQFWENAYNPIFALNENASVLHYPYKALEIKQANSLLVDAGVKYKGYCSDISRTYSHKQEFKILISKVTKLQKQVVEYVKPGMTLTEVNLYARSLISKLLIDCNFIVGTKDINFILEKRIDRVFFPHGIGHLIGLDVHEVFEDTILVEGIGNKYNSISLKERYSFTIEPGIYFIKKLINEDNKDYINMQTFLQYEKFGGIRIEDNIIILKNKVVNITSLAARRALMNK